MPAGLPFRVIDVAGEIKSVMSTFEAPGVDPTSNTYEVASSPDVHANVTDEPDTDWVSPAGAPGGEHVPPTTTLTSFDGAPGPVTLAALTRTK